MPHPGSTSTTIVIVGADTLAEDILAKLLQDEGYTIRLHEALPTTIINELLDGADLLILSPNLSNTMREAVLGAMKDAPHTASIPPVLSLCPTFEEALLDDLAMSKPWRHHFDQLLRQIEAALSSRRSTAAGSAEPPSEAEAV